MNNNINYNYGQNMGNNYSQQQSNNYLNKQQFVNTKKRPNVQNISSTMTIMKLWIEINIDK